MTINCPYCHEPAKLVGGDVIYPHRRDLATLSFWQCAPCSAWVGCHKGSIKHAPLGRLATAELRGLKIQVHALFDPLWKSGEFRRSYLYMKLAEQLGIEPKECHIGMFDEERCKAAIEVLRPQQVKNE